MQIISLGKNTNLLPAKQVRSVLKVNPFMPSVPY